jgi:hypothetical protein
MISTPNPPLNEYKKIAFMMVNYMDSDTKITALRIFFIGEETSVQC